MLQVFSLLTHKLLQESYIFGHHYLIYPWPTQIVYGDSYHESHWKNFALKNKINFLSLYGQFKSEDKKKFIFENFIYGDIHWNKNGTNLIFKTVINGYNSHNSTLHYSFVIRVQLEQPTYDKLR